MEETRGRARHCKARTSPEAPPRCWQEPVRRYRGSEQQEPRPAPLSSPLSASPSCSPGSQCRWCPRGKSRSSPSSTSSSRPVQKPRRFYWKGGFAIPFPRDGDRRIRACFPGAQQQQEKLPRDSCLGSNISRTPHLPEFPHPFRLHPAFPSCGGNCDLPQCSVKRLTHPPAPAAQLTPTTGGQKPPQDYGCTYNELTSATLAAEIFPS